MLDSDGNTLHAELSFQDCDAIGDVDEGADISGEFIPLSVQIDVFASFWLLLADLRQKTNETLSQITIQ